MEQDAVTRAVQTLRARGEAVSVRAVHALTGGSFRDLSPLLRDIRDGLADDDRVLLDTEGEEAPAPPLGRLEEAHQAAQAAELAVSEAQAALEDTVIRLQALRARRPDMGTDPQAVPAAVAAQVAHDAEVVQLTREVEALQALIESRRLQARRRKEDWQRLAERQRHLREYGVPGLRRDVAEARRLLARLEQDLTHQVALATRRVETTRRALQAAEAELQALDGPSRPKEGV